MILHLMAPFRTHFSLKDEEVNSDPNKYELFWKDAYHMLLPETPQDFDKVTFLHKRNPDITAKSRFQNVSTNSFQRPLNILNFVISSEDTLLEEEFSSTKASTTKLKQLHLADKLKLKRDSAVVRIYNNCVAILEVEVKLVNIFERRPPTGISEINKNKEIKNLKAILDAVQEFGVLLGETLSSKLYDQRIKPYLNKLFDLSNNADYPNAQLASKFLDASLFQRNDTPFKGESLPSESSVKVNWVTRSLMLEPGEDQEWIESEKKKPFEESVMHMMIDHWLKDAGDGDLVQKVKDEPDACAIRWLNYFFREHSYARTYENDSVNYEHPFSDKWEAMLFAQYYYAAFEALNVSLHATLATSYRNAKVNFKELNRRLERDVITANLITLEYNNNFGYYKREVSKTVKQIMNGWEFDDAILNQVKQKTELCEQRMDKLYQKTESQSSFHLEFLLAGIGLISIVAFLLQVSQYGRSISHDADLAVYESNSINVVRYISERPTDFIILLSLGLIIVILLYYYLKGRVRVLD